MTVLTPELEQAVCRCAMLRARLTPWVDIAAELHVAPEVLEEWPWQYRETWRPVYRKEFERIQAELVKETNRTLEEMRKEMPQLDAWATRRERREKRGSKGAAKGRK